MFSSLRSGAQHRWQALVSCDVGFFGVELSSEAVHLFDELDNRLLSSIQSSKSPPQIGFGERR